MIMRSLPKRHEENDIDDASTASELDDEPDLELPQLTRIPPLKGTKRRRSHASSHDQEDGFNVEEEICIPKSTYQADEPIGKVDWTDESDGEYERLKRRKPGTSKRGQGRGKGRGGRKSRGDSGSKRDVKGKGPARVGSDPTLDDDDFDPMIPDYIRQRRREFDEKRALLNEAGLCLPPDYSDIYFSDDDTEQRSRRRGTGRDNNLQQRPQFDGVVRPSRDRKDIPLVYSAGTIPACIAQYLRDYQVAGVQFLHRLFVYQKGGILGDDMGLGKTVQVAAFLTAAFGKTGDERDNKRMRKVRRAVTGGEHDADGPWYPQVLVVCPGSLIQNWRNELQRWGWWHVDVYHGAGKDDVLQSARAGRLEIMITTYTTYKNHRDRINTVRWDAVVADECHVLKERFSETTRAMNDVNALCRIGLTGTAIQNKYDELWTLLNWTNPGRFGTPADWKQTITRPLTIGQSHDATLLQLSLARTTARKLVENLLPEFFLRRMKTLIAHQLPRKTDRVVFCPLTERQSEAYTNFVNSPTVEHLRHVSDPCDCGSGLTRGFCCYNSIPGTDTSWYSMVFPTIQSLLKLANHLILLVPSADNIVGQSAADDDREVEGEDKEPEDENGVERAAGFSSRPSFKKPLSADKLANDRHNRALKVLQDCVPDDWATLYRQRDSLVNLANPDFCGKWKVLRKLLRFWHENGDKVLVFSHNVRLLRILQHLFHNTSYSVSYLDGSLSYDERQRVVDDFNADPAQFVFLISTKAGGVGLNITSANKVVIFDPHWNPAYDLQAQDRAYRIGQVRDVDVFRLVSAGTIEEIVYARQIYKQQQANIGYSASTERRYFKGVQQDQSRQGEIFGLKNLFAYHNDQVMLRDIVNKTNIAEAKVGVHLTAIDMEQAAADKDNEVLTKLERGTASSMATLMEDEVNKKDKMKNDTSAETNQPKSDAIQAILASAGVEYTHINNEVVGSSRVEAQLSRQAELMLAEENAGIEGDGTDLGAQRNWPPLQGAFGHGDDSETSSGEDTEGDDSGSSHNSSVLPEIERSTLMADNSALFLSSATARDLPIDLAMVARLEYNPPEDVMRRQFCTMAREAGYATATDFALVVEGWTPEQRRECLQEFYRKRESRVREQMEAARETESEDNSSHANGNEDGGEPDGQERISPLEEVASLVVINENVVERRERIVNADASQHDKKKEKTDDAKAKKDADAIKVKRRDGEEDKDFYSRSKKEDASEVKVKAETKTEDASRPWIKRELDEQTARSTQATATQATQTQTQTQTQAAASQLPPATVSVKQEERANGSVSCANSRAADVNNDGETASLLLNSPATAPIRDVIRDVISDSEGADEL
ncbi:hypothetical protein SEPCBS119000_002509 [Sporothrix epigloea]|uniref:DNA excision repair protein n=1 Tax=Sporothrix epigloea TaxID=1892477 RepID=A0ABP0DKM2_9PEZI